MTHIDLPSIWLLKRLESVDYDENDGFIITAPDEYTARLIAASNAGNEGRSTWTNIALSSCTVIGVLTHPDPTPRILLRSFNAG
jgi:hypothetical protein